MTNIKRPIDEEESTINKNRLVYIEVLSDLKDLIVIYYKIYILVETNNVLFFDLIYTYNN